MPTDLAKLSPNPTALISASVKPFPILGLWLYLTVWHLTYGLSLSNGLGEIALALALLT